MTPATISRDLATPIGDAPPARTGGSPNLAAGAMSDAELRKARERYAADALRRWPHAANTAVISTWADRCARLESAQRFLDTKGGVVRDEFGEPFPIVREIEKWATRIEQLERDLDAQAKVTVGEALAGYIAAQAAEQESTAGGVPALPGEAER